MIADDSEPEPDVAVVAAGDYHRAHPTTALLVIEVANSSLARDRRQAAFVLLRVAGLARRGSNHQSDGLVI